MSILLRLAALSCLLWAVALLVLKDQFVAPEQLTPVARALANGLGMTQLVLVYLFWKAAAAPAQRREVIYAAIFLMAIKTANDLYEILVLLPANEALASVFDLILSIALLVGLLEALPRTLRGSRAVE
jgi:hypothetical protein